MVNDIIRMYRSFLHNNIDNAIKRLLNGFLNKKIVKYIGIGIIFIIQRFNEDNKHDNRFYSILKPNKSHHVLLSSLLCKSRYA